MDAFEMLLLNTAVFTVTFTVIHCSDKLKSKKSAPEKIWTSVLLFPLALHFLLLLVCRRRRHC